MRANAQDASSNNLRGHRSSAGWESKPRRELAAVMASLKLMKDSSSVRNIPGVSSTSFDYTPRERDGGVSVTKIKFRSRTGERAR
jgi:hypothetical protein